MAGEFFYPAAPVMQQAWTWAEAAAEVKDAAGPDTVSDETAVVGRGKNINHSTTKSQSAFEMDLLYYV